MIYISIWRVNILDEYHMSKKITKSCPICNNEFITWKSSKKIYCSKACMGIAFRGKNNPNYGNSWSDEKKIAQSELIKEKINDEYRLRAGSANRGKKFSKERIMAMHGHRSRESYVKFHSDETKKLIGIKSKNKFTPEYKTEFRKMMIESGEWISDVDRSDLEIYKMHSSWVEKMWDHANAREKKKLVELGIFNCYSNRAGCVRDHKLSKIDGFKSKVYPEILRHPCNLEILTHSENASKGKKSSISLDMLLEDIQKYTGNWKEHETVLILIKKFKDGGRFTATDYKREVV